MFLDVGRVARCYTKFERPVLRLLRPSSRAFSVCDRRNQEPPIAFGLEYVHTDPKPPNPSAKNIAVLGGGITGLTAAFELARTIPHATVTLWEKSQRLGGWLDSEIVEVPGGEVLFEWGARSFRVPERGGLATANLYGHLLQAQEERAGKPVPNILTGMSKGSPVANNRYLFYPDHLVRMPGPADRSLSTWIDNVRSMYNEPIYWGKSGGIFWELFRELGTTPRESAVQDESVGDFLTRRFGPILADNFASAVLHGIYAGDIYKLSARTLFPSMWYMETRRTPDRPPLSTAEGSILLEMTMHGGSGLRSWHDMEVDGKIMNKPRASNMDSIMSAMQTSSFSFFNTGMVEWIRLLESALENNSSVIVKKNDEITSMAQENSKIVATTASGSTRKYDYVISTLPPKAMRKLVPGSKAFAPIERAVTVMVVNLYYDSPLPVDANGFGYLIPRSVPADQNPEKALGVIFAHNASGIRGKDAVDWKRLGDRLDGPAQWQKYITHLEKAIAERPPTPEGVDQTLDTHKRSLKLLKGYQAAHKSGELDLEERFLWRQGQDTVTGPKLTVMLGGHWWDDWSPDDYPSEDEAIEMAKSVIRRHLKIEEQPVVAKAKLQRDCIPQFPVGYRDMMANLHTEMVDMFEGRLKLAGPFYQGAVGVSDCIKQATWAAMAVRDGIDQTGIVRYTKDEVWAKKMNGEHMWEIENPGGRPSQVS